VCVAVVVAGAVAVCRVVRVAVAGGAVAVGRVAVAVGRVVRVAVAVAVAVAAGAAAPRTRPRRGAAPSVLLSTGGQFPELSTFRVRQQFRPLRRRHSRSTAASPWRNP
jgi:hypothetical protein